MTTLGVVIGKFLPPHRGHSYLIETATKQADEVIVIVCVRPDDVIHGEWRADALRELHPAARVIITDDDIPAERGDETSRAWAGRTLGICQAELRRRPDLVFTSEEYGGRYAAHLGARHVSVDPLRRRFPVSGTAVRADPWGNRVHLSPAVLAWFVTRICVVGAESTGTTTLCQDLASHFGCPWVPEYGREFCDERGHTAEGGYAWQSHDFADIARRQQSMEDSAARGGAHMLICDTDALATAVWHERYLGARSAEVERLAAQRRYALRILTSDDIPFVQDGTRDGEHLRRWMTERLRRELARQSDPWVEVSGGRAQRLATAIACVKGIV